MSLCVLSLLIASVSLGRSDPLCEGTNCRPTLGTLIPATSVLPPTPGSLSPGITTNQTTPTPTTTKHTTHSPTPTKHTTHSPTPTNHTTHTPTPANHTTHTPTSANHTTHTPTQANHTSPTNHTTPIPTNHTTHSVPTPTGPPVLTKGTYKVSNDKMICALATLKIELRVEYETGRWGTFFIQPNHTKASGACEKDTVSMTLTYPQGFLTFGFKKDKDRSYHLHQIETQLTYKFPGSTRSMKFTANNTALVVMETALGHCSRCSNLSLEAGHSFWVDLVDQEVQVFEVPRTQTFGPADVCPRDHKLPVVAIVVVVLLLLLIIIIVIVYLIHRKRSPAGYQSL
ncbi:macrosialin [Hypanus sabinus]|uniref:macrosialin n=1 Tax=Hypanus sabinus TaxID=79690 RepID=UPI0028C49B8F|nr:macrosialin [Hypanus sabinus]